MTTSSGLLRGGHASLRRRALLAAVGLVAALGAAPHATADTVRCAEPRAQLGEWPMFGRTAQSDRNQVAEHGLTDGAVATLAPVWTFDANRWTHQVHNEVTGYPVEKDGCVFVGSSVGNDAQGGHLPGYVFALNAENGDVVWKTHVPGGVYSTLAVDAGVVYAFVSRVGAPLVVALDEWTGRLLWQTIGGPPVRLRRGAEPRPLRRPALGRRVRHGGGDQ